MRRASVLVVEDDDAIRTRLIELLGREGDLRADGARDGAEALHYLSSQAYSVIILDMIMPRMSGADLLDSLKAMTGDHAIKRLDGNPAVIVMTGASDEDIPDHSIERRFPDLVRAVLRKPLDCSHLATLVREQVDGSSSQPSAH